jgi:hypothetical protein
MALVNKALRLQALLITLVALSCVIENGANAIFDSVTREIVKDLALAATSHVAVAADKKTKSALTHVFLGVHAFSLFDVYGRGNAMCQNKLMCAWACALSIVAARANVPIPKLGGGKKKSSSKTTKKTAAPRRSSSRSSTRRR